MDKYIYVIIYVIALLLIFSINYFFVYKLGYKNIGKSKRKKNKTIESFIGFSYLIPRFKLDINKMNISYMFLTLSIINSVIITTVSIIVMLIPLNISFQMLIGFVLLFCLIYSLYEIFGRHLVKKGWIKTSESKSN